LGSQLTDTRSSAGDRQDSGSILRAIESAPVLTAWVTSLLEFFGGVSIMIGAFVVPLSVPLIIVMLTAMFRMHL
jgi:uncharacterized membrane protein YphA (DoxX/SURF4 family)